MSEKLSFTIEYDEEWYLFDSTTISEQLVKEQAEYGYGVFANSLSPSEVVGLLNEQQNTIQSLQDLCGKSDYENAKLRLKNKELQDKIDHLCEKLDKCKTLKKKNKQLGEELDNFKPVMFQDMRKGTVILYSKGCKNEYHR